MRFYSFSLRKKRKYAAYLELWICLAYIPETVMNCDVDYVNKLEKYKCLGNTIDGNIFNKHNDQKKKTLVKRIFFQQFYM